MYFIWMLTINIQYKIKVHKTKGCLINIFTRQVTVIAHFFVSGAVLDCFSEYVFACTFGF